MRRVVIGIGNPDRGDDGAGRAVACLLRRQMSDAVEVFDQDGEATALLARIEAADSAVLIDASFSGAPGGTVRRFDVAAAPLPRSGFAASTHGFGLIEAVELARSLGQLPPHCVVFAVEGTSYGVGEPMTAEVVRAIPIVAERVRAELADTSQGAI